MIVSEVHPALVVAATTVSAYTPAPRENVIISTLKKIKPIFIGQNVIVNAMKLYLFKLRYRKDQIFTEKINLDV